MGSPPQGLLSYDNNGVFPDPEALVAKPKTVLPRPPFQQGSMCGLSRMQISSLSNGYTITLRAQSTILQESDDGRLCAWALYDPYTQGDPDAIGEYVLEECNPLFQQIGNGWSHPVDWDDQR